MKLLALHDKPRGEMGGMNTFIAAQNALFVRAGWSVSEIICTPTAQPGSLHLPPSGRRSGLQATGRLRRIIAEIRPDALIAHSVYYALGPQTLHALQEMIPSIYVLHDVTPLCPRGTRLRRDGQQCARTQGINCISSACYRAGEQGRWMSDTYGLFVRALQTRAARSVQQWVVPSRYLAGLLQLHGIPDSRIALVPHFVDDESSDGIAQSGTLPVPGRLLYAGRLVPEKGIGCLLQALSQLGDIDWSLHICGSGPERGILQQQVAQRGWETRIRFFDTLDRQALAKEYRQAAVVVMPSLIPESFGLVGLEAMRHARPVAGFASGGMSEWLRDDLTGRIAAWGDAQSLAQILRELLERPGYAQRLGEQGRALALQEFSPEIHLRRMREVLERTIAQHATRSSATTACEAGR